MDDSRVKRAAEILTRFFDERTIQEASRFEEFRSTWRQIVGQRLADHSKPRSIVHRTLLIAADHAGWIQLLQMDQARILERISKHYPELEISSLAFTVEMGSADGALSAEVTGAETRAGEAQTPPLSEPRGASETPSAGETRAPLAEAPRGAGPANAELPSPLSEIFSRMRSNDARRVREKGN